MTHLRVTFLFALLAALRLGAAEANWPEFRGPRGDGTTPSSAASHSQPDDTGPTLRLGLPSGKGPPKVGN